MKALVADDDPVSLLWLETLLTNWGYQVIALNNGLKAYAALAQGDQPQLAILDWMMPGLDGFEICRRIKQDSRLHYHYLIMLTGKSSTDDIVAALQAGADDFVAKPFKPEELQVRLRAGARVVELQQELMIKASHDALTGMLNRRMLIELSAREVERAWRSRCSLLLLMLDVDKFKKINDQWGHRAGDEVLIAIAARLKTGLRSMDLLGRYGGEEFMIVLPQSDLEHGLLIAEHLRLLICSEPVQFNDVAIAVSISIGIAKLDADNQNSLQQLMDNADRALYRAKAAGRNRIECAD